MLLLPFTKPYFLLYAKGEVLPYFAVNNCLLAFQVFANVTFIKILDP